MVFAGHCSEFRPIPTAPTRCTGRRFARCVRTTISRHLATNTASQEPVLYVAGRPHVLRLVDRPLVNVEQKGITTAVVERMEKSLKQDLIRELRAGNGRVLVHDEIEDPPGNFTITALWETIEEKDVLTPRDVFERMREEGYRVDYGRVAIVSV